MAKTEKISNKEGVDNTAMSSSNNHTLTDEELEECSTKENNENRNCKGSSLVVRSRIKQQYCVIQASTSDIPVEKKYSTKCNPNYFQMGVKDLTSRQIEDVRALGFSGLLMIKLKTLPLGIVPWLVQNFNPRNRLQNLGNGNMYYITPDDVHDILGLPIYPDKKIEAVTHHGKGQTKDPSLVKKWMDILKVSKEDDLTLDKVVNAFSEHENGGDIFKCLFILFSVSSFLSPNSERKVDKSLFKVLEDVSQLPRLDWCSFVLYRLCTAVRRYFENTSQTAVNGCVLVLLLAYLHRMPYQGILAPLKTPLVQNWVDDRVKKRAKSEFQVGYGEGIMNTTTFPICKVYKEWAIMPQTLDVGETTGLEIEGLEDVSVRDNVSKPCNKVGDPSSRSICYSIPDNLPSNLEIKSRSKNHTDESLQILKRDMEVVFAEHVKRLATTPSVEKDHSGMKVVCLSQEEIISQTQRIMENPDWQALMDDVINQMLNISNTWPSLFENDDNAVNEDQEIGNSEPRHNVQPSNDQELGNDVEEYLCSINLGQPNVEVVFISRFMKGNRLAFMGMAQLEKEVNDYCFLLDSSSTNEVLVSFSEKHSLLRADILTLETFQEIDSNVIECWALYLNEFVRESKEQPLAFCFGLSHSVRLKEVLELQQSQGGTQTVHFLHTAWKDWLDCNSILWDYSKVEMFFVPYYHGRHYSLVVINLIARSVQYLDNIRHPNPKSSYDIAEKVRGEFSTFLESLNHPKAAEVVEYVVEIVDFPWTVNANNDCGVYLMYFMERFDGTRVLTPLKEALKRRLYRASICARLATCDMNKIRGELLQKVVHFTHGKQNIMTDVDKTKKSKRQDLVSAPRKSRRTGN